MSRDRDAASMRFNLAIFLVTPPTLTGLSNYHFGMNNILTL